MNRQEQDALIALLASFIDLYIGYDFRELHEPPGLTVRRALALLPEESKRDIDIPEEWLK